MKEKSVSLADFRDVYPRYPPIESVEISQEEREYSIDLRPYMNPSPYSVQSYRFTSAHFSDRSELLVFVTWLW